MKNLLQRIMSRQTPVDGEDYFFGCIGMASLIFMTSSQIRGNNMFRWMSSHGFAWTLLLALELLTVGILMKCLYRHRLKLVWTICLPVYWVAYDVLLMSKRNCEFLALIYGASQAIFYFYLGQVARSSSLKNADER